jgi:hypothetical protein
VLEAAVAGGSLAGGVAVLRVTRSAVLDEEVLGLVAAWVERCAPKGLVNCVGKVGVKEGGATALIDMVTSFSR